ncbi:hypothetical protein [Salipaludibacillus keqinensis]|nr:hypothetical protein [Salipaludibacillus keqinensis]
MGKPYDQKGRQSSSTKTGSVNPLGKSPGDADSGEVLSEEQNRAKKKNTK